MAVPLPPPVWLNDQPVSPWFWEKWRNCPPGWKSHRLDRHAEPEPLSATRSTSTTVGDPDENSSTDSREEPYQYWLLVVPPRVSPLASWKGTL
jgi:hypothetical protein